MFFYFMDNETFEQPAINAAMVDDAAGFLKEGLSVIWLVFSLVIVIVTFFWGLVVKLAELLKIIDPNNLIFFQGL